MHTPSRAVHSLGYNPLTYADPTGNTAVHNLEGDVCVTWPDGFTVRISRSDAGPLVAVLTRLYRFSQSRKGLVWGHKKKAPSSELGAMPETNDQEGTNNV